MRTTLMRATLAASLALAPMQAMASDMQCPNNEQRAAFQDFQDKLARAGSPEQAKELALAKIELSHKAIKKASKLVSDGSAIARADAKLDTLEQGVLAAQTQQEVAAQFANIGVFGTHCHYDTAEIVIIVVGFVLGILPGVIFMLLFC